MSDTPRTDAAVLDEHDPACAVGRLCRQLERELTAAQASMVHNKELHDRLLLEYASVDTEIRKAAVAVGITQEFVDGDSYCVPGPEELVECIVGKFTAAQAENARLQERVKRLEKAMHALAAIIGPLGKQTWATDEQLNQAWELYLKTKGTQ